jgi:hypothetical protein
MEIDAHEKIDTAEGLLRLVLCEIEDLRNTLHGAHQLNDIQAKIQKAQAWLRLAQADRLEEQAAEQRQAALEVFGQK